MSSIHSPPSLTVTILQIPFTLLLILYFYAKWIEQLLWRSTPYVLRVIYQYAINNMVTLRSFPIWFFSTRGTLGLKNCWATSGLWSSHIFFRYVKPGGEQSFVCFLESPTASAGTGKVCHEELICVGQKMKEVKHKGARGRKTSN